MIREAITLARLQALTADEAAALLVTSLDETNPAQAAVLDAWLEQSPDHRTAWRHADQLWASFDVADDTERAEARQVVRPAPQPWPTWAKAAACFAAALALGAVFTGLGGLQALKGLGAGPVDPLTVAGAADFMTAKGQMTKIALTDGSVVELGPDSAVDVAFDARTRGVRLLRGRAYFQVAHDRQHPFVVTAGDRNVTALGTAFDVRLNPDGMRVSLVEGRVSVASSVAGPGPRAIAVLQPGQQLVHVDGLTDRVEAADLDEVSHWRDGWIAFDNETLGQIVADLNQRSTDQIVIDDPKVAALRLTGQFKPGDIARFSEMVTAIHPVKVVRVSSGHYKIVQARR